MASKRNPVPQKKGRLQAVRQARRRLLVLGGGALLAIVVAAVLGLGYATSRGTRPSHGTTAAPAGAPVARAGSPALTVPDFAVTTAPFVGGQRFVLSEHTDKPTLMYFMAAWCVTCIPEARAIAQLQGEMGQQVNFVILDIDPNDTELGLAHFWKAATSPTNVWALDRGSTVTSAYHVNSLDTTILIANGKEVARTVGPRSVAQLKEMLAAAGAQQ